MLDTWHKVFFDKKPIMKTRNYLEFVKKSITH